MDKQSKFLDKDYLTTRLRDFTAIKKKLVWFDITDSDRTFSKSIYINLYTNADKGSFHSIRISDHPHEVIGQTQFLIEPNEDMTKKKKEQFIRVVELGIKKARFNTASSFLRKFDTKEGN